ncbi:MAG TPA: 30S ribosomal protein S16 [Candidatus Dojkabacteria bacterium]|jgi:small subunit ribosomal protein S16|nr:30S ribosomal protein S16 [Candidatus Dojkabacteria bacterium]
MLKIRLKRVGRSKDPSYRIVVMESAQPRGGKTKDEIGFYDPRKNLFDIDKEKAEKWLKNGAQPTDTVAQYFVKEGLLKKLKRGSTKPSTKKKAEKTEE